MYSSRGTNAYGQQSSGGQSGYTQDLGAGYSGSSVRGPDGGAQMSSWHSSILDISQEAEVGRYRALPSVSAHYGGQYSSLYGTTALSTIQQVPAISSKGAGASTLEVRSAYASAMPDSPNLVSSDYVSSSSHRYSHKGEQMYAEKIPDYPTVERRQYDERQGVYKGRELPSEATGRYADSANFSHKFKQPDIYDRVDQAILHRPEQSLKAQSTSIDGILRQVDYLPARGAASRHSTQDHMPYEGRVDSDTRSLSFLIASYGGQLPSILGAAPRKNMDDLMHPPNSANPGYGVSLPPGRDYGTKGLHATSIESEYPGSALSHIGHPRIKYKDDGAGYLREIEFREEERRRDQLREREKDREREREKERERLRERERERERLRFLERREKERERERKRALQVTRKRTRTVSKDNRGPSLSKEVHPVRRDSPCCEASHRRLSPVKEKRREYICKVYSSTLVDVERDYMSINKRYPRLFVSAEFSKVVINWPKEDIKLSMHTPVSFEHYFVEEDSLTESKELPNKLLPVEPEKPEQGSTIWNAKMILMSGLSKSALEELSSEKIPDDRIPHICNILRFAVLKKEHSLMAIGGPWVSADGTNPANDNSPLIQTVLRYAKDVVSLDLQNCQHWNRFLEIHYDRVGKDGLFSHKEVTVLFVPDLSECLPSFDTWRAQWLAHRKSVSEREHQISLKREKSKDRKEGLKDKVADSTEHTERGKLEKRTQSVSSSHSVAANKKEKNGTSVEVNAAEGKVSAGESKVEVKDGSEITVGGDPEIKVSGEAVTVKTAAVKSVKKKVIKRIVKRKVAYKTAAEVNTISNQGDKVDEDVGENSKSEIPSLLEEPSAGCADQSEATVSPPEAKVETQMGCSEDKAKDNSDAVVPAVENASLKTIVKRKIIKRVPKRKVPATQVTDEVAEIKKDGDEDEKKVVQARSETSNIGKQTGPEEQGNAAISSKSEIKANKENKKDEKVTNMESLNDKQKVNTKSGDVKGVKLKEGEKPKDEKDGKVKSQGSPKKELNETRKSEEPPPKHPGFILQTRWSKDSKFCSSSRSLDSLLDYTEKDIEESTSELSLFAETLYEMLQYQMGCLILTFFQKLRVRFITKRNQLERQREEICENEIQKKSPTKRLKSDELPLKNVLDTSNEAQQTLQEEKLIVTKEETTADNVEEPKTEDEIADEENEEDPEEYEEMDDVSQQINSSNEKNEEEKTDIDAKPEEEAEQDEKAVESTNEEITTKGTSTETGPDGGDMSGKKELKVDPKKKVHAVDKDLLQAFRFFDRNRVGYIRVDDLRLIIHNMGKFLSYRDVKELVQSALLETNTGRDDHILYNKLVHMSDI